MDCIRNGIRFGRVYRYIVNILIEVMCCAAEIKTVVGVLIVYYYLKWAAKSLENDAGLRTLVIIGSKGLRFWKYVDCLLNQGNRHTIRLMRYL